MKVDNPRFELTGRGEVERCAMCPLDRGVDDTSLCLEWWIRDGNTSRICPDAVNYQEACRLAEQADKGEKE